MEQKGLFEADFTALETKTQHTLRRPIKQECTARYAAQKYNVERVSSFDLIIKSTAYLNINIQLLCPPTAETPFVYLQELREPLEPYTKEINKQSKQYSEPDHHDVTIKYEAKERTTTVKTTSTNERNCRHSPSP